MSIRNSVHRLLNRAQTTVRSFGPVTTVVVGYPHPIAEAQACPIRESVGRSVCIDASDSQSITKWTRRPECRVVLLQSQWDVKADQVGSLIDRIREGMPTAKIVFLDWYAPVHLPQTEVLPLVDLYVKKHVLKDREPYSSGMYDTNLVEYEAQWQPEFKDTKFLVADPGQVEQKLFVGWNFGTDRLRRKQLRQRMYDNTDRPIDLHCRICAPNSRDMWYTHMRGRAYDAAQALANGPLGTGRILVETKRLALSRYLDEITHSKLCFSPFGYGEVCWRDFESILAGAVLVKPEMSHLLTHPNIYVPHETYVPVRWDFADLESQCERYLKDACARKRIITNAVAAWQDYLDRGWVEHWRRLTDSLAIDPIGASPLR